MEDIPHARPLKGSADYAGPPISHFVAALAFSTLWLFLLHLNTTFRLKGSNNAGCRET